MNAVYPVYHLSPLLHRPLLFFVPFFLFITALQSALRPSHLSAFAPVWYPPFTEGFARLSLPDRSPLLKNSILPFIPGSMSVCVCVCECAYCASVSWQTLWILAPVCLSEISSADSWVNFHCDILSVSPLGSRCRSKLVWTNVEVYLLTEIVKRKNWGKIVLMWVWGSPLTWALH